MLLLREASYGATRFDDFAARANISEPVAAARLRELVAHGILDRHDHQEPGQRTRKSYALTPRAPSSCLTRAHEGAAEPS